MTPVTFSTTGLKAGRQLQQSAASKGVPAEIREALQDAMEIAIENVPRVGGQVFVCPDVSGSMSSAVTGYRKGATSAVRCIDVAALVAAAIVRKNPTAQVLPFEQDVVSFRFNPRDSVMFADGKLQANHWVGVIEQVEV